MVPRILIGVVFAAAVAVCPALASGQSLPADAQADRIVVEKAARTLSLYRDGRVLKTYKVALGANAEGPKEREGDGRTPEGKYVILQWDTAEEAAKD